MKNSRVSGEPSRLRRFLKRHKSAAIAVPVSSIALMLSFAMTASAAGSGVSRECIPTNVASNQKGGWNDPVAGSKTQTVQRSKGSTRRVILWQGTPVECPANSPEPCTASYNKGESKTYNKVINITGGLAPGGGGQEFPVPFPIITASGYIKNESKTLSWNQELRVPIKPGQRVVPVLAVDYQQWSGNFVGAYHHAGEDKNCHQYYLSPNEQFGSWRGEVATKEYITFDPVKAVA